MTLEFSSAAKTAAKPSTKTFFSSAESSQETQQKFLIDALFMRIRRLERKFEMMFENKQEIQETSNLNDLISINGQNG